MGSRPSSFNILLSFQQTYFLPVIGLVDAEKLKPGDLVVSGFCSTLAWSPTHIDMVLFSNKQKSQQMFLRRVFHKAYSILTVGVCTWHPNNLLAIPKDIYVHLVFLNCCN